MRSNDDHALRLELGIIVGDEVQAEFARHLAAPLFDQRRGRENEHTPRQFAHEQFQQDQSGFDGLAQSHFIA